jgi:hypothetical protein
MTVARVVPVVVALLTASVGVAVAHETGAIHLVSKQLAPGGELAFAGEKLPTGATLKVELRGALNKYAIGTITTDKLGKVQARLTVPPDVPNGNYTVAVIAPDGDVAARAPLVVTAASAKTIPDNMPGMSHDMPGMAGMKGMGGMSGPHATAEMMPLDQRATPGQWAVIAAVVSASLAAGAALLRKAARLAAGERGLTPDTAGASRVRSA